MENTELLPGYRAIKRLVRDLKHNEGAQSYWLQISRICLDEHYRTQGDFAGAWVFDEAKRQGLRGFNNLRRLVSYGILRKEGTSRKGRRAYYSMVDPTGVERALLEVLSK